MRTWLLRHRVLFCIGLVCGVAIPISTALENMLLPLVVIAALVDSETRKKLVIAWHEPFIKICLVNFVVIIIGCLWSDASLHDRLHMVIKMSVFAIIPFAYALSINKDFRYGALSGYTAAILITLLLSYISWITQHPILHGAQWSGTPPIGLTQVSTDWGVNTWCPFRAHAYHSFFLGLLASGILSLLLLNQVHHKVLRIACFVIIGLITFNLFYMVSSRTGQIAYIMMLLISFITWKPKKGSIISAVILVVFVPLIVATSPVVQKKISLLISDVNSYHNGDAVTSVGLRMAFHKYSWELIKQKPVFGHGTGSYAGEYLKITNSNPHIGSRNPHSDYLWYGVELGFTGIVLFSIMLLILLIRSITLPTVQYRSLGIIIAICYAAICVENSFVTDSVTGIAFILFASWILSSRESYVQENAIN